MSLRHGILVALFVLCTMIVACGSGELEPTATMSNDLAPAESTPAGADISPESQTVLPGETAVPTHVVTNTGVMTDAHRVPSVALSPGESRESTPGSFITFTHLITNTGPSTDVFEVDAISQHAWTVELLDHQQTNLTSPFHVELGALDASAFVVGVRVPDGVTSASSDQIEVKATSSISTSVMTTATDTVAIRSSDAYTGFLPVAQSPRPPLAKLGVDFGYLVTESDVIEYDFPLVRDMGANWMRVFLRWRDVEVSPREYQWNQYDPVFERIEEMGMQAIVAVHAAPDWAAEQSCGPISDTVALETFLESLVPRYAAVTRAWEFINEPDGGKPHEYGAAIGCWGLYPDGYAQQLQIFHAKVRDLDNSALVFFGGLAYDSWYHFVRSFFDEALQGGAGPYFDGVSLHYYPINPVDFPTMAHKVNEIQETMTRNGVEEKRIWVTETGMWVNRRGSVEQQRDFIVRELARGFGAGADNIFWFDPREHEVGEGVHRWLISEDHEPINGYDTFVHLARRLEGLHCIGPYEDVPDGVEAYAFSGPARSLYVLWSESVNTTVSIPSNNDGVLINRDGTQSTPIPADLGKLTFEIGAKPVFLEIRTQDTDRN